MPREIRTYKASPVRPDAETPSLAVLFECEPPEFKRLGDIEAAYRTAAKEVVEAMGKALPGGFFDAILVEMMAARVSLFCVPLFTESRRR